MKKKDILMVCNSPFQIFVAFWLKHTVLSEQTVDIIISDHMNNGIELFDRISKTKWFNKCYFVESLQYARQIPNVYDGRSVKTRLFPQKRLKDFLELECCYDFLYAANPDDFTILLYNCLSRFCNVKFVLTEDGVGTYTTTIKRMLEYTKFPTPTLKSKFAKIILFREKSIIDNTESIMVFRPDLMMWEFRNVIAVPKIDINDKAFVEVVNYVFKYDSSIDQYEEKYIIFEDGYYGEGWCIGDDAVIEKIANIVGRKNVLIKLHPRNEKDRFKPLGYKTTKNNSIPWEVVYMNMNNIQDKVFLTMTSSAALNMILIFNERIKVFSYVNLLPSGQREKVSPCLEKSIFGTFTENGQYVLIKSIGDIKHLEK